MRLLIISALLLAVLQGTGQSAESLKTRVRGPVTITSQTLTADNKARTVLFRGTVVARTTDMTLNADSMLVTFRDDSGDVTSIDASGNVSMRREGRVIFSEKAVYYSDGDKVVFTGEPRAVDGENVVTGTEITYFVGEDRSVVEHGKVILKNTGNK